MWICELWPIEWGRSGRETRRARKFTPSDLYHHADFVTYPSIYEGFGNALLEAIYFRKPVLINRYSIFIRDIEPKGFRLLTMDGFVTPSLARRVKQVLEDQKLRGGNCEPQYEVARQFYSYSVVRSNLRAFISVSLDTKFLPKEYFREHSYF